MSTPEELAKSLEASLGGSGGSLGLRQNRSQSSSGSQPNSPGVRSLSSSTGSHGGGGGRAGSPVLMQQQQQQQQEQFHSPNSKQPIDTRTAQWVGSPVSALRGQQQQQQRQAGTGTTPVQRTSSAVFSEPADVAAAAAAAAANTPDATLQRRFSSTQGPQQRASTAPAQEKSLVRLALSGSDNAGSVLLPGGVVSSADDSSDQYASVFGGNMSFSSESSGAVSRGGVTSGSGSSGGSGGTTGAIKTSSPKSPLLGGRRASLRGKHVGFAIPESPTTTPTTTTTNAAQRTSASGGNSPLQAQPQQQHHQHKQHRILRSPPNRNIVDDLPKHPHHHHHQQQQQPVDDKKGSPLDDFTFQTSSSLNSSPAESRRNSKQQQQHRLSLNSELNVFEQSIHKESSADVVELILDKCVSASSECVKRITVELKQNVSDRTRAHLVELVCDANSVKDPQHRFALARALVNAQLLEMAAESDQMIKQQKQRQQQHQQQKVRSPLSPGGVSGGGGVTFEEGSALLARIARHTNDNSRQFRDSADSSNNNAKTDAEEAAERLSQDSSNMNPPLNRQGTLVGPEEMAFASQIGGGSSSTQIGGSQTVQQQQRPSSMSSSTPLVALLPSGATRIVGQDGSDVAGSGGTKSDGGSERPSTTGTSTGSGSRSQQQLDSMMALFGGGQNQQQHSHHTSEKSSPFTPNSAAGDRQVHTFLNHADFVESDEEETTSGTSGSRQSKQQRQQQQFAQRSGSDSNLGASVTDRSTMSRSSSVASSAAHASTATFHSGGSTLGQQAHRSAFVPPLALASFQLSVHDEPVCVPCDISAAVMMVDVSKYSAISRRLEARGAFALHEVVNSYLCRILTVIERQKGEALKFSGDAVSSVFYFPDLRDSVCAALHCAAALQAEVGEHEIPGLNETFNIHIGISCGELRSQVFRNQNAKNMQQSYHFVADVPREERRMKQLEPMAEIGELVDAAAAGETCVSTACKELACDSFEFCRPSKIRADGRMIEASENVWKMEHSSSSSSAGGGGDAEDQDDREHEHDTHFFSACGCPRVPPAGDEKYTNTVGDVELDVQDFAAHVSSFVPPSLKALIKKGAVSQDNTAEMRLLTVLFIAKASDSIDVEDWAIEISQVLAAQGATIVQITKDDKALQVIAITSDSGGGLKIARSLTERHAGCTIGIATGVTFSALQGDINVAVRWDISGWVPIRAARLMQYALEAGIPVAIGQSVVDYAGDASLVSFIEKVELKGTVDPVPVYGLSNVDTSILQSISTPGAASEIPHKRQYDFIMKHVFAAQGERMSCLIHGSSNAGKFTLGSRAAYQSRIVAISHVCVQDRPLSVVHTMANWFSHHHDEAIAELSREVLAALSVHHNIRSTILALKLVDLTLERGIKTAFFLRQGQRLDAMSVSFLRQSLQKSKCTAGGIDEGAARESNFDAANNAALAASAEATPRGRWLIFVCVVPEFGMPQWSQVAAGLHSQTVVVRLGPLSKRAAALFIDELLEFECDELLRRAILETSGYSVGSIEATVRYVLDKSRGTEELYQKLERQRAEALAATAAASAKAAAVASSSLTSPPAGSSPVTPPTPQQSPKKKISPSSSSSGSLIGQEMADAQANAATTAEEIDDDTRKHYYVSRAGVFTARLPALQHLLLANWSDISRIIGSKFSKLLSPLPGPASQMLKCIAVLSSPFITLNKNFVAATAPCLLKATVRKCTKQIEFLLDLDLLERQKSKGTCLRRRQQELEEEQEKRKAARRRRAARLAEQQRSNSPGSPGSPGSSLRRSRAARDRRVRSKAGAGGAVSSLDDDDDDDLTDSDAEGISMSPHHGHSPPHSSSTRSGAATSLSMNGDASQRLSDDFFSFNSSAICFSVLGTTMPREMSLVAAVALQTFPQHYDVNSSPENCFCYAHYALLAGEKEIYREWLLRGKQILRKGTPSQTPALAGTPTASESTFPRDVSGGGASDSLASNSNNNPLSALTGGGGGNSGSALPTAENSDVLVDKFLSGADDDELAVMGSEDDIKELMLHTRVDLARQLLRNGDITDMTQFLSLSCFSAVLEQSAYPASAFEDLDALEEDKLPKDIVDLRSYRPPMAFGGLTNPPRLLAKHLSRMAVMASCGIEVSFSKVKENQQRLTMWCKLVEQVDRISGFDRKMTTAEETEFLCGLCAPADAATVFANCKKFSAWTKDVLVRRSVRILEHVNKTLYVPPRPSYQCVFEGNDRKALHNGLVKVVAAWKENKIAALRDGLMAASVQGWVPLNPAQSLENISRLILRVREIGPDQFLSLLFVNLCVSKV